MSTVHEFLSRLVVGAQNRPASDPRGPLEQAGSQDESGTDVLREPPPVLDFVRVEADDDSVRTVRSGADRTGGNQHLTLNHPMPAASADHNQMEFHNMATPDIFSSLGDVDSMLRPAEASNTEETTNTTETSTSEDTTASNNPVGTGNEFELDGLVGDINAGDINGVTNSGDLNSANVAGNGVTDVVGGVQGGDVMGQFDDISGAGDLTGGLQDFGATGPELGDVTNALPVEDSGQIVPQSDLMAPVTGADSPVENTAGDLTSGLAF